MVELARNGRILQRNLAAALELKAKARDRLFAMSRATLEPLLDQADEKVAPAAYQRSRGEERVPAAVVDRLLAGDNPVRLWREHRDLTLEQLRDKAGLSIGYLSDIHQHLRRRPDVALSDHASR